MRTLLSILGICASLTLARGQTTFFTSSLDGAQNGGGLRQGTGFVNLSLSGVSLFLNGSYSGLTTASTAGHIHGPAAPGTDTGVIYPLDSLGIISLGSTSGTYNGTLTIAAIGGYTVSQQLADLNAGLWYFNIHNSTFPGGEIRGQIIVAVPEPSSLALLGLGGLGLFAVLRRRAK